MKRLVKQCGYLVVSLALCGIVVMQAASVMAAPVGTTRVNVSSEGVEDNDGGGYPGISADGRYVVFESYANTLVAGDTNDSTDVFLRDTTSGITTRVSVSSTGEQGNGYSSSPSVSADGRYVTFVSWADNLINGDTNESGDIFVHDTQTGITKRVSVSSEGDEALMAGSAEPSISADGRHVAFASWASNLVENDLNNEKDIFVHDTQTNLTTLVSVSNEDIQGDRASFNPSISADGRYVAFATYSSNYGAEDASVGESDVYVRDVQQGSTTLVGVNGAGQQANAETFSPSISADGRFVAFQSAATNLVANDTNGRVDIFVHDTLAGTTVRASVNSAGGQVDGYSNNPSISANGDFVAFISAATNLVTDDTNNRVDVFVRDMQKGITVRASLNGDGVEGNDTSEAPKISADGLRVAYRSYADNLVPNDTNDSSDIFLTGIVIEDSTDSPTENDTDGPVNGVVVDPARPATLIAGAPNTGVQQNRSGAVLLSAAIGGLVGLAGAGVIVVWARRS